jgi:metallo-beta-lactamase family protein
LFTRADAQRAIAQLVPLPEGKPREMGSRGGKGRGPQVTLTAAGHLLGACSVTMSFGGERLVYSGDLGRQNDLLMPPPLPLSQADVLIVESTYGNRLHPQQDVLARLGEAVRAAWDRGGSLLLPAFAVGRAQALLVALQRLRARGEIPVRMPIFVDSPMAAEATALYRQYRRLLRVPQREMANLCDGVTMVGNAQQSLRLARAQAAARLPAVIISASGMATGGRVLNHLAAMAPNQVHHILFPGFQAGGTRGELMVNGARDVKIRGEYVPIRAQVSHLEGFSGHADAAELLQWLRNFKTAPRQTFVVHGEPAASDALRQTVARELGWKVRVPPLGGRFVV